jgi:uncharacterized membrane protein YgdD (TMEM256/DUF423 family)
MQKKLLILGAVLGLLGVILGAFASHGLEKLLTSEQLETFQVGVRYQFYHAFLALVLGSTTFISNKAKNILFVLLLSGVTLFSGSIYGLSTNSLTGFDFTKIALLTPTGGLLLISAWVLILFQVLKMKTK